MTPEQKANWLRDLMIVHDFMEMEWGKKCALVAVHEILDVLGDAGVYSFADPKVAEYWQKVKEEIKKL